MFAPGVGGVDQSEARVVSMGGDRGESEDGDEEKEMAYHGCFTIEI